MCKCFGQSPCVIYQHGYNSHRRTVKKAHAVAKGLWHARKEKCSVGVENFEPLHSIFGVMTSNDLRDALISEVECRIYDECLPRILKCIDMLDDDGIWWHPNPNSNSIGNLVLHLAGNVRQWIYTGLGKNEDVRNRQTEFEESSRISKDDLKDHLIRTMNLVKPVIAQIQAEELLIIRPVQTFEASGLTILIHVTEHFSYHTGQIAYITKMITNQPLGFYAGVTLQ